MTNINNNGALYRGNNPITNSDDDTVAKWVSLGPGIWMFTTDGKVIDKPANYGIVLSLCRKGVTEVHQVWFDQPSGNAYHRGGNVNGWSGTWKLFSPGTANAAQVLTGYTFSSANGSNISGTMKNYSSSIQTATTSTSDQTKSCYRINNGYMEVVPAIGYWGLWDWSKSCIKVPDRYSTGYNAGVTAGTNSGYPNSCTLCNFTMDNESAGSWTCSSAGYYIIFVYGHVTNSSRYETPNLAFTGTYKAKHDASTVTNDRKHTYLYYFASGQGVSWTWSVSRGTYPWRNGVAIIKVR